MRECRNSSKDGRPIILSGGSLYLTPKHFSFLFCAVCRHRLLLRRRRKISGARACCGIIIFTGLFFIWVLYAARMDAAATLDNLGLIWKFFPLGSFHVIFSVSLFLIGVVQLMNFWIGYFPSIWVVWLAVYYYRMIQSPL